MDAQRLFHLLLTLTWIVFSSSVCSGMHAPQLSLEATVFVAFEGENLTIDCEITKPAKQSKDRMVCFDPLYNLIYVVHLPPTQEKIQISQHILQLNNVIRTGEYNCRYQGVSVYWFIRVRAGGYEEPLMFSYTEFIIVAVLTSVLLVFSVVGSIYVFRGHWKQQITKSGKTSTTQRQNSGDTLARETEENNIINRPASTTSFYASLQARPRSIYDVLDHSAANMDPDQRRSKPNKNEHTTNAEQTTKHQGDDVFECVYENF